MLKACKSLAGSDIRLETATLHGIPLYDGDLEEREGISVAVQALKARLTANEARRFFTRRPAHEHIPYYGLNS